MESTNTFLDEALRTRIVQAARLAIDRYSRITKQIEAMLLNAAADCFELDLGSIEEEFPKQNLLWDLQNRAKQLAAPITLNMFADLHTASNNLAAAKALLVENTR
jgi:hypothetical protein